MQSVKPYIELLKIRIASMVGVTAAIGFVLGTRGDINWVHLLVTLIGTAATGMGAGVLNNCIECEHDRKMIRTAHRAIPAGLVSKGDAIGLGLSLVVFGVSLLASQINLLTGFLALLTAFIYVIIYTPLKRVTWLNTMIGAIPGALPPLGGWAAATGELGLGGWLLFALMFVWQHPHFYAIAWIYREDYERGGYKMLSVVDPQGRSLFPQIVLFSLILLPVSILPSIYGLTGDLYFAGALFGSLAMFVCGIHLLWTKSRESARALFGTSLVYLPILLALVVTDRTW